MEIEVAHVRPLRLNLIGPRPCPVMMPLGHDLGRHLAVLEFPFVTSFQQHGSD